MPCGRSNPGLSDQHAASSVSRGWFAVGVLLRLHHWQHIQCISVEPFDTIRSTGNIAKSLARSCRVSQIPSMIAPRRMLSLPFQGTACVVITYSRAWTNRVKGCQSCSWSVEQEKRIFPCPRSCLRIWSYETDSAVPSRVIRLILHTHAKSGAYSRDSSQFPRRGRFIYTANRHRFNPEFIRSHNCVPITITAESPPAQGQQTSR